MQNPVRRSEHYRERAAKDHELAKRAHPPYLGEFYRGIAVRHGFMAQELSQQAEKELERTRVDATTEVSRPDESVESAAESGAGRTRAFLD
jgi:hypothetical protein